MAVPRPGRHRELHGWFAENSMRRYEHMLQRKKGTPGCPVLKAGFINLAGLWTLARIKLPLKNPQLTSTPKTMKLRAQDYRKRDKG